MDAVVVEENMRSDDDKEDIDKRLGMILVMAKLEVNKAEMKRPTMRPRRMGGHLEGIARRADLCVLLSSITS